MNFERMLTYSKNLANNNDRAWFKEHHQEYEIAWKDFLGMLDFLRFRLCEKAPDIAKDIMYAEPKVWTYRIPRDMRYYRGNEPYNPAFRAYICADKKCPYPIGYYIHIGSSGSCYGTGIWFTETSKMNDVREYLENHFEELEALLKQSELTLNGDKLKTVPKGFSQDSPAAEYLKMKNWTVLVNIDEAVQTMSFEQFDTYIGNITERMEPIRHFLLRASQYKSTY